MPLAPGLRAPSRAAATESMTPRHTSEYAAEHALRSPHTTLLSPTLSYVG